MKFGRLSKAKIVVCLVGVLTLSSAAVAADEPAGAPASSVQSNKAAKTEAERTLSADAIAQLKTQIAAQQKQIEQMKLAIDAQQQMLDRALSASGTPANGSTVVSSPFPTLGDVASRTPIVPGSSSASSAKALQGPTAEAAKPSPLFFPIGAAKFTPFGFIDLTQVIRSTNAGGGIGTGFNGIPFNNTTAGQLSESRFSLQNSRIGLRVDSAYRGTDITGYLETDFLGNAPTNLAVTSNAATLRLRLFWLQLKKDKWEILAGQSWSMMTPGRKGISPIPGDLFYSQDVDTNYQNGLTWARQPTFRFVYHPTKMATWGLGVEASDQYVGGAVTFPGALTGTANSVYTPASAATAFASEFDNGAAGTAAPNMHPDIVSKLALDGSLEGRAMHFEVGGILRTFRSYNPLTDQHFTHIGGGGTAGLNLELVKGFRVIGNGFVSSGGGRYIFGSGPDLIGKVDGDISLVHSLSTVDGFEYSYKPKGDTTGKETLFYTYYGGAYFRKNSGLDLTGKAYYGYGFPGSALSANRTINQFTFGVHRTFWKSANYGDLRLMTQYSYLTRDPWVVPAINPQRNAYSHMVWINLRYDLP